MVAAWILGLLLVGVSPGAQSALPTEGYQLDAHHGFVVGSRRVLGLGGAYTAVAEGADGLSWTAAAFANRPRSIVDRTSWTLDVGANLSVAGSVDLDGDGRLPPPELPLTMRSYFFGGNILSGDLGFGLYLQSVSGDGPHGASDSYRIGLLGAGAGWAMNGGEFVLGVGGEIVSAEVGLAGLGEPGRTLEGESVRANMALLYRAPGTPLRVGVSIRSPVVISLAEGDLALDGEPDSLHVPRRVNAGIAYMFGPAAKGWNYPMKDRIGWGEAVRMADGRYVMLSLEFSHLAAVTTPTVTTESFLSGEGRLLNGEDSVSVHFGAESETIRERLRTRLGLYTVPNRTLPDPADVERAVQEVHITGGFDLRVLRVRDVDLRLSFQFDLSGETYRNIGVGLGFWEPSIALKRAVGIPATL